MHRLRAVALAQNSRFRVGLQGGVFILKRSEFDTTLFFSGSRTGKVWTFWNMQNCLLCVYVICIIYIYVHACKIHAHVFLWNYLIVLSLHLSNKHHILPWGWFKSLIAKCCAKLNAAFNRYFTIKSVMKQNATNKIYKSIRISAIRLPENKLYLRTFSKLEVMSNWSQISEGLKIRNVI